MREKIQYQSSTSINRRVFRENGYPTSMTEGVIRRFVAALFSQRVLPVKVSHENVYRVVLPFLGAYSLTVRKRVLPLIAALCPNMKVQVVFRPTLRVSQLFRVKDPVPRSLVSNVVYMFSCGACNAS